LGSSFVTFPQAIEALRDRSRLRFWHGVNSISGLERLIIADQDDTLLTCSFGPQIQGLSTRTAKSVGESPKKHCDKCAREPVREFAHPVLHRSLGSLSECSTALAGPAYFLQSMGRSHDGEGKWRHNAQM
jgi:hypothetical protein